MASSAPFKSSLSRAGRGAQRVSTGLDRPAAESDSATPLPAADRAFFERRFDRDFSGVRIHADARAAAAAARRGANAYTAGGDIVFGEGHYRPGTTEGRRLLAHELAHVAQQSAQADTAGAAPPLPAERGARLAADRVASGGSAPPQALGAAPAGVYLDPDEDPNKKPLPPVPNFQLSTPPIDMKTMHDSFRARAQRLSLRDADELSGEWKRGAEMLRLFGITDSFKLNLGLKTITRDWILNKGLSMQLDDRLSRDNPNSADLFDRRWRDAGGPSAHTLSFDLFSW